VLPWYRKERFRFAGAALLVGVVIGGLVTMALGYSEDPPAAIPERSDAAAIASDQAAARPTPTATPAPKARKAPAPAATPAPTAPPNRPPPNSGGGGDDDDPGGGDG
jgi:hypothetical protein